MKSIRNPGDRDAILSRVLSLTGNETAKWGKMNVGQMVSHLVQTGTMPFEATLPDRSRWSSRKLIKPLILYLLPMPKEVKTSPDLDQRENGRKPGEFADDKRTLAESIARCAEIPVDQRCSYHPFFGPMTPKQWGILAHKHIDHHLKQFGV